MCSFQGARTGGAKRAKRAKQNYCDVISRMAEGPEGGGRVRPAPKLWLSDFSNYAASFLLSQLDQRVPGQGNP